MSSNVTAPAGMTRAEALEGLWRCSRLASFFQAIPNGVDLGEKQAAAAWESKEKVEQIIKQHPYVDYFGGRCIKTNLSKYPKIDLASYREECDIPMSFAEIFEKCLKHKS